MSGYPAISETFILREVQGLRERGMEIEVASINRPKLHFNPEEEKKTYYIKEQGIRGVIRSFCKSFFFHPLQFLSAFFFTVKLGFKDNFFYRFFYLAEALLIAEWLEENKLDHLHVHFANPASTVALIATKLKDFRFSMTIHGSDCFEECTRNLIPEKLKAADFVICVSHFTRSQLMKFCDQEKWKRLEVIRLGVDLSKYHKDPKEDSSVCQILCVARLIPAKGLHLLIDAIASLKKKGLHFHLVLVGGGERKETFEQYAKEKEVEEFITFTGALSQEETKSYYQQADLFVLPSFAEGVPVVLMEALAFELPSIATQVAGIPEIIEEGVNGFIIAPGVVEDIAEKLTILIQDKDLRKEMGRAGRKKVGEEYSLPDNLLKLYNYFTFSSKS